MAVNSAELAEGPWEPPSEAEMKVMTARRERQDKISKIMGEYLLKGYKMLGESCDECGTILLQDRQRKNYCVACMELDSDVDKDNPALNPQAALSQVRERRIKVAAAAAAATTETEGDAGVDGAEERGARPAGPRAEPAGLAVPDVRPGLSAGQGGGPVGATAPLTTLSSTLSGLTSSTGLSLSRPGGRDGSGAGSGGAVSRTVARRGVEEAEAVLVCKMAWASRELQHTASVEGSTQLCALLKVCADSLLAVRRLL
ncbi:protein ZNRD2 [Petromyzon marinus]|uniref:Protein ZNRD2 n=1 Tax=Petromyzon marinus TaxID=7757 RepID=A0AAJ7TIP0_PETMA|nr:protein ZNRD2 [Petromyzon marinus]